MGVRFPLPAPKGKKMKSVIGKHNSIKIALRETVEECGIDFVWYIEDEVEALFIKEKDFDSLLRKYLHFIKERLLYDVKKR